MLTLESLQRYTASLLGATGDIAAFGPETVLAGTIVVLLLARLVTTRAHLGIVALAGAGLALYLAYEQWSPGMASREIFQGMLVADDFTVYLRLFLLSFTVLVIVLTMLTGIPDAEDSADFHTLLLGSVIGMAMMAAANNLLMIFLAVEMASVPSYAMAGFLKGRRQSSEAALKYVVYGGAAAGVMLYGLTLLGGMYGSLHLPSIAKAMLADFAQGGVTFNPLLLLALMLILVGVSFKLSAFPFHFWCPDVFEGAAAEVAAFLSVASKGAAVALVARFTMTLSGTFHGAAEIDWAPLAQAMTTYLSPTLAVIAAITCTFGNLAAYGQTNLKRLFAYSTIAHAGYMMMALVPLSDDGVKAALFYLVMYLFMNLGAFAVVAFARNRTGSESLEDYVGMVYRAPWLTVAMAVFLLSLAGLPPLAGFVAKFQIFSVLYDRHWYTLLVIGGINSVLSLVYYVNILRVMIVSGQPRISLPVETFLTRGYAFLVALPVLVFGILWQSPENWSAKAAKSLDPSPGTAAVRRDSSPPAVNPVAEPSAHREHSDRAAALRAHTDRADLAERNSFE